MLYNIEKDCERNDILCTQCTKFDKTKKLCNGLGSICVEYDIKTNSLIDPITGLVINSNKE